MKKDSWSILALYKEAFAVSKQYKVLWPLGLAALGISFDEQFRLQDRVDLESLMPSQAIQPLNLQENVLGISTTFSNTLFQALSTTNFTIFLLLGIEIILFILFSMAVSFFVNAWAKGLHIKSVDEALKNKSIDLKDSSDISLKRINDLIWLDIVPPLLLFLIFLIIGAIVSVGIVSSTGFIQSFFILLAVLSIGAFIYWFIFLRFSQIWGIREIILNNQKGKDALLAGYRISKGRLGQISKLALANTLVSFLLLGLPMLVIGGITELDAADSAVLVLIGSILWIPLSIIYLMLLGAVESFKAAVWNRAYHLIDKGDK